MNVLPGSAGKAVSKFQEQFRVATQTNSSGEERPSHGYILSQKLDPGVRVRPHGEISDSLNAFLNNEFPVVDDNRVTGFRRA